MKKNKKYTKEKTSSKTLIILGTLGILIVLVYYSIVLKKEARKENAYQVLSGQEVPDSMVCMVSNSIKLRPTLAYNVDGRVYRGCCPSCGAKLIRNIDNSRYAIDPFTNKTINKAKAFIMLIPDGGNKVQYFESRENHKYYLNESNKKSN